MFLVSKYGSVDNLCDPKQLTKPSFNSIYDLPNRILTKFTYKVMYRTNRIIHIKNQEEHLALVRTEITCDPRSFTSRYWTQASGLGVSLECGVVLSHGDPVLATQLIKPCHIALNSLGIMSLADTTSEHHNHGSEVDVEKDSNYLPKALGTLAGRILAFHCLGDKIYLLRSAMGNTSLESLSVN